MVFVAIISTNTTTTTTTAADTTTTTTTTSTVQRLYPISNIILHPIVNNTIHMGQVVDHKPQRQPAIFGEGKVNSNVLEHSGAPHRSFDH